MTGRPWGTLNGVRPSKIVHYHLDIGKTNEEVKNVLMNQYQVSMEKAELLIDICYRQKSLLPKPHESVMVGVYVGIPFCPSRCHYCSFPSYTIINYEQQIKPFINQLLNEIREIGNLIQQLNWKVSSFYIGGGTPTTLCEEELDMVLTELYTHWDTKNLLELTVEAGRPETVNEKKLACLMKHGVTRISINPQTMHNKTLQLIGRRHEKEDVIKAVEMVKRFGIPTLNMDLIIGLPEEGIDEIRTSLDQVIDLAPENITIHTLALKKATYWREQDHQPLLPSNQLIREMGDVCHHKLVEAGYKPYYLYRQKNILGGLENVGYSLEGKECLYNIQMMEDQNHIIGLGVGAMSKLVNPTDFSIIRKPNPKDPIIYQNRADRLITEKIKFLMQLPKRPKC